MIEFTAEQIAKVKEWEKANPILSAQARSECLTEWQYYLEVLESLGEKLS